jgi:hypothetical protein
MLPLLAVIPSQVIHCREHLGVLGAEPATLRLQNVSIHALGLRPPALFRVDQAQIDRYRQRSRTVRPPGSLRHLRRLAEDLLSLRELAFPQVRNAEVIHVVHSSGMLGTTYAPIDFQELDFERLGLRIPALVGINYVQISVDGQSTAPPVSSADMVTLDKHPECR